MMQANNRNEYLAAKVQTASPAQLHLMLIEGALRFMEQAEKAMMRQEEVASNAALVRVMEIVEELLVGVRHSSDEINEKLAQLYQFVFTQVSLVYVNQDRSLLADARRILEFDRDTWRAACASLRGDDKPAPAPTAIPTPHIDQAPIESGIAFEA